LKEEASAMTAQQNASRSKTRRAASALVGLALLTATPAFAADCAGKQRAINIGVAVTPPNVVHTPPYVAKELGYFAKYCVDARIIQFEGGQGAAALAAVAQGQTLTALDPATIAQGLRGKQLWAMAPRAPQDYFVTEEIKTAADLKGKRLSAAGGVGAFNWRVGRDILKTAGLGVDDARFISQGTEGRLPGLIAGQLDGVLLHPEDVYIAEQKKPGAHSLVSLTTALPNLTFNTYGAADVMIARDHNLLRDTIAAMMEANRAIYRERDKVIPIMVEATQKPREAVEYAWSVMAKNCIWAVNTGFNRARTEWSIQYAIDAGDIDAGKHPTFDNIVDTKLADEALAAIGGPTTINNCTE
jgi:ABC-type nitrate/sulfonate/bicarbonate transport system substrate-binding protein